MCYFMVLPNRVNDRFEEGLLVKVRHIEHPSLRQPVVNGHWAATLGLAKWGEGKEDFHIFLQTFLSDRLLQFRHLCPSISDCKNHTMVRHVLQGDLNSWGQKLSVFLIVEVFLWRFTLKTRWEDPKDTERTPYPYEHLDKPRIISWEHLKNTQSHKI